jgi:KipI family sensor histidine kinase inhibitor
VTGADDTGKTPLKLLPAGEAALLVELGDAIDPGLNEAVHRLDAAINRAAPEGLVETVPTYRSILVNFDPTRTTEAALADAITSLNAETSEASGAELRRWFVPVRFGGEHGEDLNAVAERARLTPEEVVDLHCAAEYRVYMLGFSPGFAYLGGLPEALHQPRRENPRSVTPAGSFMQGGAQAALSPVAMPSGWHLIGKTPLRLFDPGRSQPFLLAPGDRVRLVSVTMADYDRMAGQPGLLPESEAIG